MTKIYDKVSKELVFERQVSYATGRLVASLRAYIKGDLELAEKDLKWVEYYMTVIRRKCLEQGQSKEADKQLRALMKQLHLNDLIQEKDDEDGD